MAHIDDNVLLSFSISVPFFFPEMLSNMFVKGLCIKTEEMCLPLAMSLSY